MNNWAEDSLPGYMDQATVGMAKPGEGGLVATGLNKQISQGILKAGLYLIRNAPRQYNYKVVQTMT